MDRRQGGGRVTVTQFCIGTFAAFVLGYCCGIRSAAVDITTYETAVERDEEDEWEAA